MSKIDRRKFCSNIGVCGSIIFAGCINSNTINDTTSNPGIPFESIIQSIYIWDYGPILATNTQVRERFYDQMHNLGVNTIFLSWGALQSVSLSNIKSFIKNSHEQNLQVHALIGTAGKNAVTNAKESTFELLEYNNDRSSTIKFDGIQLNIEPRDVDLDAFLNEYRTLLEELLGKKGIQDEKLTLSSAIGWWWGDSSPENTAQLVEHESLNYIVVMAYWNTEQEIRNRLSSVVSKTEVPYVLAVETQEFPKDTTNKRVTFYEEGKSTVNEVLGNIITDPPTPEFSGVAYHYYQSSVSKWNSLKEVGLSDEYAKPGDEINILVTVIFDDNFPDSAHRCEIVVEIEGSKSKYTTTKIIEPTSREPKKASINWNVPRDISPEIYSIEASLNDIVFVDTNREAINKRSDPIKLDKKYIGEINITQS